MPEQPTATPKRIKSYLPVGVCIHKPDGNVEMDESEDDITYFYVKEHLSSSSRTRDTLFVANCPVVPQLRTSIVLQSLLGRYGEVKRVAVVENPRKQQQATSSSVTTVWTTNYPSTVPHFLSPPTEEGKFAHVIFESPKELKKTLRALEHVMSNATTTPYLTLDPIEIQTLRDDNDGHNDTNDAAAAHRHVLAVAERYRASCPDRDALLLECNRVMQEYEEDVARQEQERLEMTAMADEDGFIPVSYANTHKKQEGLEIDSNNQRKSKKSRSRKKKKVEPLTDFYRFQTKEQRKKNVEHLRDRFEKDLAHMKKMREERKDKPF